MTYTTIGIAALNVATEDGEDAYPERVLVACSQCGSVVAKGMTDVHEKTHEVKS